MSSSLDICFSVFIAFVFGKRFFGFFGEIGSWVWMVLNFLEGKEEERGGGPVDGFRGGFFFGLWVFGGR